EAAATYKHLANREKDPKRRDILLRLAEQEDKHAARWSERIALSAGRTPDPGEVERCLSWFQRISDPNVVLHRLEQEENKAEAEYEKLMARLSDPIDRQIAEEAMHEERDHAVVLRTLSGGGIPTPRSTLDTILRRERWHVQGTGWIGDAIYGVNDGLGAVFGIVSGMAGYTGGSEVVLDAFGQRLDRGRRLHPDHPVLLRGGHAGRHRVVRHQHRGAFCRRRLEGARHDAILVGQRRGNDDGRDHRSRDHIRSWRGVRPPLIRSCPRLSRIEDRRALSTLRPHQNR